MDIESRNRTTLSAIAAVARALGTAILSLTLGSAVCIGLLLGGGALTA